MKTITEDYVSLETAKLLNEKGFDIPVRTYYENDEDEFIIDGDEIVFSNIYTHNWNNSFVEHISAPTQAMAMKWLREVHNIYLNINVRVILGQWSGYDISVYTTDDDGFLNKNIPIKLKDNLSYEQAVEAAIKYILKNLI